MEFGRIYQVKLEAGEQAQKVIDDVLKLSVVNSKGEMVPFSSFTQIEQKLGMDQINRYNMYSAASITITPAAGSSSGQAIEAVGSLIKINWAMSLVMNGLQLLIRKLIPVIPLPLF